jgi:hypothetical protein
VQGVAVAGPGGWRGEEGEGKQRDEASPFHR